MKRIGNAKKTAKSLFENGNFQQFCSTISSESNLTPNPAELICNDEQDGSGVACYLVIAQSKQFPYKRFLGFLHELWLSLSLQPYKDAKIPVPLSL
jgi:hypothetical protein